MLERRLGTRRTALSGRHPELAHRALRELLRGERLRVGPDAERGFRVEGTAWLSVPLEERGARNPQDSGRLSQQVAGGRYARYCRMPVPLLLPVVGRVMPRAA
jgi:hypothetical protein